MKIAVALLMLVASVPDVAFARSGTGKVDCSMKGFPVKAVYSWFRDATFSGSSTTIFVGNTDDDYLVYNGENAAAAEPISVQTVLGIVVVSLTKNEKTCSITIK